MAADAQAPCITRSWKDMVLNMNDNLDLVPYEEGFWVPVPSQCWEMIENVNQWLNVMGT